MTSIDIIKNEEVNSTDFVRAIKLFEELPILPVEVWRLIAYYTPVYYDKDQYDLFSVIFPKLTLERLWQGRSICTCNNHTSHNNSCNAKDHVPIQITKKQRHQHFSGKKIWKSKPFHHKCVVECTCRFRKQHNINGPICRMLTSEEHNCSCGVDMTRGRIVTHLCKALTHKCICRMINDIDCENFIFCKASMHYCICTFGVKQTVFNIKCRYDGTYAIPLPQKEYDNTYIIEVIKQHYIKPCICMEIFTNKIMPIMEYLPYDIQHKLNYRKYKYVDCESRICSST